MATRREELTAYLRSGERTAKDLASMQKTRMRDVLDDLEHVRRSAGRDFVLRPAQCSRCDFIFGSRPKMSTPSRCPECRSERICGPWLSIKS